MNCLINGLNESIMAKKTVIIGATPNPSRYAYLAAQMLTEYNHEIVPLSIKKGEVSGKEILDLRTKPAIDNVDTVTLYIGPQNQPEWYDYIISLKPKRIIFNPGTENDALEKLAEDNGIEAVEGCTLVMLRSLQY
jgi:uncharacterized protein